jgi:hypothetical protein
VAEDSKDLQGFSALSRAYKADPTIENYVRLRRQYPTETIEVAVSGGIDWLFGNEGVLKQFHISPNLIASALDADEDAISELSLLLLERIIERKKTQKSGKTHAVSRKLAIGDELVNFLINLMLDSLDWNDRLLIPRDLIVLIRHQTGGGRSIDWDRREELKKQRWKCFQAMARVANQGKAPTIRTISKNLGVSATTVMRWFPDGDLAKLLAEMTPAARTIGRHKRKG